LRATGAAKFARHEAREDDGDGLHKPGEKPEAGKRSAEEQERKAREEWRDGRIGNVTPGEVAGVVEEREFVAIEAVAIAGEEVKEERRKSDSEERDEIATQEAVWWRDDARGCRKNGRARIVLRGAR
jgi:hypothetical protein